ncbi:PAS domain-containing protein [Halohasta litchfieldiae]|jgi:PAS domain-containing protein|uniref:PAS fold n=1 Tax=Halohasta litchfieldiae TaxID=1073996 RepID=A0A1H6XIV1_9EURY|nr:PAS domain-containing protein [Halohasta litchfieldiae]ATW90039.1 PAS domain-containing protein [Halohasta litchfieldiae]SEJ24780.1 PAS fold [Halohasta litchfieldiae]
MKRFLNRLLVTEPEPETTERIDEERVSDSVEWRDISIETNGPTGWASDPDPEEREPSQTETPFGTLDVDYLMKTVLDGVAVPTLVVDCSGEIVSINSAACERFGTTEADAIGTTPAAVHGGQRLLGQVLLTGEEITDRRDTVIVDGTGRTIRRTINLLKNERGEIVGAVETIQAWPTATDTEQTVS